MNSLNFSFSFLLNIFNDTDCDGLFHISDGESTKWWEFLEFLNTHRFGWDDDNDGGVTLFDGLWEFFSGFTCSSVDLGLDFLEFAGNVSGVAIHNWTVTGLDLTWMVHNDDLSSEVVAFFCWIILGV
jgi:hypothetical protein